MFQHGLAVWVGGFACAKLFGISTKLRRVPKCFKVGLLLWESFELNLPIKYESLHAVIWAHTSPGAHKRQVP